MCHISDLEEYYVADEREYEMKHTKGPWIIGMNQVDVLCREAPYQPYRIVANTNTRYEEDDCSGIEEAKANAQLIAAAPELLEFLKSFVQGETTAENIEGYVAAVVHGAKELIKKAEGNDK